MIRDARTAQRVLESMNEAHKLLMDSLALVRTNCSKEEHNEYQAAMAHVVGRLFFLLMEPIYRQHPSLVPPNTPREFVEAWAKSSSATQPKPDTE